MAEDGWSTLLLPVANQSIAETCPGKNDTHFFVPCSPITVFLCYETR